MVGKVKLALRIGHNYLDEDIADTIKIARAEMIRSGVSQKVADSEHPLIQAAIKTYCKMEYEEDANLKEGYQKSWLCQLDNIRKSSITVTEEVDGTGDIAPVQQNGGNESEAE